MQVWITRDRKTYQITSEKPVWNKKDRFWFSPPGGFRAIVPAALAEELLGGPADLGGCVRRELLLVEPPAMAGTVVIGEGSGASGEGKGA